MIRLDRAAGLAVVAGLAILRGAAVFVDVSPSVLTAAPLLGPSSAHWLGTDQLGRDVLARVIDGSEAFVVPGLLAVALALLIGVPLGAGMGFWPRSPVSTLGRFSLTIIGAWPRLVLVVVTVSIFTATVSDPAAFSGVRLYVLAAIVAISFLPQLSEELAERVLTFRREEFVEAARAHGLTDRRILVRHILWANCREMLLRQCCLVFAAFLLVETSLSYLGDYGVPPPRPSWGNILSDVRAQVIHVRTLLRPDSPHPSDLAAGIERAVHEGAALALLAPTSMIVLSVAGLLALARSLGREVR